VYTDDRIILLVSFAKAVWQRHAKWRTRTGQSARWGRSSCRCEALWTHWLLLYSANCREHYAVVGAGTSITGRTSTVPRRAVGIRAAMPNASSRSWASIKK